MNDTRINNLLKETNGVQGLVFKSPSHIGYLTNVLFPYPDQSPFNIGLVTSAGKAVLIIPAEWKGVAEDQNWSDDILYYTINEGSPSEAFCKAINKTIINLNLNGKAIAVDYPSWTVAEINRANILFQNSQWSDCDKTIRQLRMKKDQAEVDLLHQAAVIADRGIIGALNHAEGTIGNAEYTLVEFLERVRVHAIEFGSSGIGHLNVSMGKQGRVWFTPVRDFSLLENGNFLRVNYTHEFHGYWNLCNRTFFIGLPRYSDDSAYRLHQNLISLCLKELRAGIKISDFCSEVIRHAKALKVELFNESEFGHGIGLSEVEWPLLTIDNPESFQAGMVIVLDIISLGPNEELIQSTETILIEENGYQRLSDFRDWDDLYCIVGCRTTH